MLLALRELYESRADVLVLTCSGLSADALRALQRMGFRPREPQRMSFYAHPSHPLAGEAYHQQENWYIAEIDSDGLFL